MAETEYQVLARKYRPATFADLIGQDAMVRTLKNAFATDRIAQAFMMTGIRGTGKTTTARIIAKGMNCVGVDGTGGPTTDPCGVCEPCKAIAAGRHVDVIEMDAASNTGVADMREIIDSVNYRAASARYKIYIIDEVHMLSTSAFNALLKTLEEPPAHVKFIFATTEIRKVPVTVLSRCQRFDLRRIEPEVMIAHLDRIAGLEGAKIAQDALALITRAAEGSVRDAMSLLDQAISQNTGEETTAETVRDMLGLADRARVTDLFEKIVTGDAAGALTELSGQYADGADPVAVLRDLAELTHWISVVKITPDAVEDPTVSPDDRARGQGLAERLSMRVMTRMWQMLLKALEEVALAPNAMMAAEMAIIRLTHVADLPSPEDLLRALESASPPPSGAGGTGGQSGGHGAGSNGAGSNGGGATSQHIGANMGANMGADGSGHSGPTGMTSHHAHRSSNGALTAQAPSTQPHALDRFARFEDVVDMIRTNRDVQLLIEVESNLRLVSYSPGRIAFQPTPDAARDLAQRLAQRLQAWTGVRWGISVESEGGADTITEAREAEANVLKAQAMKHPLVSAVFATFPTAKMTSIRSRQELEADAAAEALPEVDDEWDPFEED